MLAVALLMLLGACADSSGEPAPVVSSVLSLRVACLNVWAVPIASKDLDARFARMLPALRALAPDLVCLQEVFLESTRSRIVAGLGPSWSCTAGTAGGLLVASRLPIERSAYTAFPIHPELSLTERLARKGFLEVIVASPAGRLRVVTTHLAAEWSEDGARKQQQDFLLEALGGRVELPLLLAGDLNTAVVTGRGPTPAWRAIQAAGFTHAEPPRRGADDRWSRSTPTRVGWPRDGDRRPWSPDHVLLRGSPAVDARFLSYTVGLDTRETAVSDHNLLLATFHLTPR